MDVENYKSKENGLFFKAFCNELLKHSRTSVKGLFIDYLNLSLDGYKTIFNAKLLFGILFIPIYIIIIIICIIGIISILQNGWDWMFLFLIFGIACCGFASYEQLNSIYSAYNRYIEKKQNVRSTPQ